MALILPKQLKLTHRVLKNVAKPITFEHPVQLSKLAIDMHELMAKENGIGLAAPQIGISRRLFVMNVNGVPRSCFNPEILHPTTDQLFTYNEGCLSFPKVFFDISRPRKILARYQDFLGNWEEHELEELEAICYQHEYDHLDGIVMHDRYESGKQI